MRNITRIAATVALLALVALLTGRPAETQTVPVVFASVTYDDTSGGVGFLAATLRPAGGAPMQSCRGTLETAQIRVRYDGGAPTSTVGEPVEIGSPVVIHGLGYLDAFRGIRTGASSGVIQWHCTRDP